eukprot:1472658-Prymnesium_polylepis.1
MTTFYIIIIKNGDACRSLIGGVACGVAVCSCFVSRVALERARARSSWTWFVCGAGTRHARARGEDRRSRPPVDVRKFPYTYAAVLAEVVRCVAP